MAKRAAKKSEPFSAGMFSVEGRLFSSRAEALAYCKAQRIPAFKVALVPPPRVDLDALKLSVRENWTLRVLFSGDDVSGSSDPVLIFEHATEAHAFTVKMVDLVDLAVVVRARVRELAKSGELS